MGLDVYLYPEVGEEKKCPHCNSTYIAKEQVYDSNITHNLAEMADKAGLYQICWRPEELGLIKAKDLIPGLKEGLAKLLKDPEYFKRFNSSNGWGDYYTLVNFVTHYLEACTSNPDCVVEVSR